jgi:hypothetical protein
MAKLRAEDFLSVEFTCPACETPRTFSREDRWNQQSHTVKCMGQAMGGYFTCTAEIRIETRDNKTYVTYGGRPVASRLVGYAPR